MLSDVIQDLKVKEARKNFDKLPRSEEFQGLAEMFVPGYLADGAKLTSDQCRKMSDMFETLAQCDIALKPL